MTSKNHVFTEKSQNRLKIMVFRVIMTPKTRFGMGKTVKPCFGGHF